MKGASRLKPMIEEGLVSMKRAQPPHLINDIMLCVTTNYLPVLLGSNSAPTTTSGPNTAPDFLPGPPTWFVAESKSMPESIIQVT